MPKLLFSDGGGCMVTVLDKDGQPLQYRDFSFIVEAIEGKSLFFDYANKLLVSKDDPLVRYDVVIESIPDTWRYAVERNKARALL